MKTELIFSGGVYLNKHTMEEGELLHKHTHTFSHTSVVAKGAVALYTPTTRTVYTAGDTVEMPPDTLHSVEALTAATWICVHIDDPDGMVQHE
jgi:quercetin dioxygenase-like cupin family protein